VADTFDALTTNRPYQQAHDTEDALRIIHSISGKRLDPAAVTALEAVYRRGEIQVPQTQPMAAKAAAGALSVASSDHPSAPASIAFDRA
jgi:HD-GYP domain-containing protein (c-di-GMP phosphodiesterase class II)